MTIYKYSKHALGKHGSEMWNAKTINEAMQKGLIEQQDLLIGNTADIICGFIGDDYVGLVVSKEVNGERVIITGFSAPREYWLSV
jgi:hypothetical protein